MNRNDWVEIAKKNPRSSVCWCVSCGEVFSSHSPFDKHRTKGKCLSSAGMLNKGMSTNGKGYWITREMELEAVV